MSEIESKLKYVKVVIKSLLLSSNSQFYTTKDLLSDYKSRCGSPIPYKELGYHSLMEFLKKIRDTIEICETPETIYLKAVSNNKTQHLTELITKQKKTESKNSNKKRHKYVEKRKPAPIQNPFIPFEVEEYVYKFLLDKPLGVPIHFLESYLKKHTNFNLEEMDGIVGLVNYCQVFQLNGEIVSLNKDIIKDHVKLNTPVEKLYSGKLLQNIIKILKNYPEGISCTEFLNNYRKEYKKFIEVVSIGYTSLLQFLADKDDIIVIEKMNDFDWNLILKEFIKKKNDLDIVQEKPLRNSNILIKSVDLKENDELSSDELSSSSKNTSSLSLDSNCIEQQKLPSLKAKDTLQIIITEIYSPTLFWVNLYSPETLNAFYKFFDDIQDYYRLNKSSMKLEEESLNKYKYAIVLYQSEWHRVMILNQQSEALVNVFFIDSGSKMTIHRKNIYRMKNQFYSMPSQAICGTLSNITHPFNLKDWPIDYSKRFKDLVINKPLTVVIKEINNKENYFSGVLFDTSTRKDLDINKRLIEEKLAINLSDRDSGFYEDNLKSLITKSFKEFDVLNQILECPLISYRITINPNFKLRQINTLDLNDIKTQEEIENRRKLLKQIYLGSLI